MVDLEVMKWAQKQTGFTIVELLIVIVVIGILAGITIVAYNGIQNRARNAGIQSHITGGSKQIKSFAVTNGDSYPTAINSCPTPSTGALCVLTNNNTQQYAVDNTASPRSYCFSATNAGASYYIDATMSGALPGSCALKSCYEIQQVGGSHGSGMYWIQPAGNSSPFRVYCDMETSGGGWTLLVTNPAGGAQWNSSTILSLNSTAPSIATHYSILGQADNIKSNIGGNLNYKIDAENIGRWGGVWRAPFSNSFVGTTVVNNATNIEQYDSWNISTSSSTSLALTNVMPWIAPGTKHLTTWVGVGSWYGTLVTSDTTWKAAPYINGVVEKANIIWYWVR